MRSSDADSDRTGQREDALMMLEDLAEAKWLRALIVAFSLIVLVLLAFQVLQL